MLKLKISAWKCPKGREAGGGGGEERGREKKTPPTPAVSNSAIQIIPAEILDVFEPR